MNFLMIQIIFSTNEHEASLILAILEFIGKMKKNGVYAQLI